ncbi:hypothetical protein A2966_03635 [Candidatus Roizmanbacteria bacterium RIFCSPLOWO2_01_FULL_41_22]|uniref:Uncharacterized protein n=1 Tax=Candidatus Roizmanbacteria bacterium RIFCSPLOWO2_01_FULL_41_22 TaxID=1802067 RepID=A0A1F7J6T0_9BACT|nr:MAG: hypothetical protein A2966_03635 [Candidatus Roizmanbacteria bacterium RIFCSPLOWO2_01_FULL_41_22]
MGSFYNPMSLMSIPQGFSLYQKSKLGIFDPLLTKPATNLGQVTIVMPKSDVKWVKNLERGLFIYDGRQSGLVIF